MTKHLAAPSFAGVRGALGGWIDTRVGVVAKRFGCTEGQVYSMVIATTFALVLAVAGGVPLGRPVVAEAAPPPVVVGQAELPTDSPVAVPDSVDLPDADLPEGFEAPNIGGGDLPDGGPTSDPEPTDPPTEPQPEPLATEGFAVPAPGLPAALAVLDSTVFVGTSEPGKDATLFARTDGGKPRAVDLGKTRLGALTAAVPDGGSLLVTDADHGTLVEVDPVKGSATVLATLPDLPPCLVGAPGTCQPGLAETPPTPTGVAVKGEDVFVSDLAQGVIWRYNRADETVTAFYSSTDFATGTGPSGLAVDTNGDVVYSVAQSGDLTILGQGAVYRVAITPVGVAGTRSLLAAFPDGGAPGALAVGSSGSIFVALAESGGVVAITPEASVETVSGAGASDVPAPRGLALAEGALAVADQGKPSSATSGQVVVNAVEDGPYAATP